MGGTQHCRLETTVGTTSADHLHGTTCDMRPLPETTADPRRGATPGITADDGTCNSDARAAVSRRQQPLATLFRKCDDFLKPGVPVIQLLDLVRCGSTDVDVQRVRALWLWP